MWRTSTETPTQSRQILRFAFGITLAATIVTFLQSPIPALLPVLTSVILKPGSKPLPRRLALYLVVAAIVLFSVARWVTGALLVMPAAEILLTGWLLYLCYYGKFSGVPAVLPTLGLIGALTVPVLGSISLALASTVPGALGLLLFGAVACSHFAFFLWPLTDEERASERTGAKDDWPPERSHRAAVRATLVVFPVFLVCLHIGTTDYLTGLVYAGLTLMEQSMGAAMATQLRWMRANLLGAFVGIALVWLGTAVQSPVFDLLTIGLVALFFGRAMAVREDLRPTLGSAVIAILLIATAEDAAGKAGSRVMQVVLLIAYLAFAQQLWTLLPHRKRRALA